MGLTNLHGGEKSGGLYRRKSFPPEGEVQLAQASHEEVVPCLKVLPGTNDGPAQHSKESLSVDIQLPALQDRSEVLAPHLHMLHT